MISLQIQLIDKAENVLEEKDVASAGEEGDGFNQSYYAKDAKALIDSFFAELGELLEGDKIVLTIGSEE